MTGIKLPKLCPYTWTVDLLDDSYCLERDRGIILCGMWSLWNSHNDRRHGKVAIAPELAIEWAMDVCFQLMTDSLSHKKGAQDQVPEKWRRPPNGYVKVNTDGAFTAADYSGATDAVDSVASALMTEAEALIKGWNPVNTSRDFGPSDCRDRF